MPGENAQFYLFGLDAVDVIPLNDLTLIHYRDSSTTVVEPHLIIGICTESASKERIARHD